MIDTSLFDELKKWLFAYNSDRSVYIHYKIELKRHEVASLRIDADLSWHVPIIEGHTKCM